jgi:hypothetical protein
MAAIGARTRLCCTRHTCTHRGIFIDCAVLAHARSCACISLSLTERQGHTAAHDSHIDICMLLDCALPAHITPLIRTTLNRPKPTPQTTATTVRRWCQQRRKASRDSTHQQRGTCACVLCVCVCVCVSPCVCRRAYVWMCGCARRCRWAQHIISHSGQDIEADRTHLPAQLTHRTAPHRTAPHRTAPHRTAPHRTAPHRTAPHRTSPHRTAPH